MSKLKVFMIISEENYKAVTSGETIYSNSHLLDEECAFATELLSKKCPAPAGVTEPWIAEYLIYYHNEMDGDYIDNAAMNETDYYVELEVDEDDVVFYCSNTFEVYENRDACRDKEHVSCAFWSLTADMIKDAQFLGDDKDDAWWAHKWGLSEKEEWG